MVQKCLLKNPKERYLSFQEVMDQLEILHNEAMKKISLDLRPQIGDSDVQNSGSSCYLDNNVNEQFPGDGYNRSYEDDNEHSGSSRHLDNNTSESLPGDAYEGDN